MACGPWQDSGSVCTTPGSLDIPPATATHQTTASDPCLPFPAGPDDANPIDQAWAAHGTRPPAPQAPVRVHPLAYAGETVASKVARLAGEMGKEGADVLVAGTLDEVAWLLNVRGDDVPNCPLATAYAVLEREGQGDGQGGGKSGPRAVAFVEAGKLGSEARRHLVDDCGVEVRACVELSIDASGSVCGQKV